MIPNAKPEPLYAAAMHREMRWASGSMVALFSIGWARASAPVIRTSLAAGGWDALSGLAAVALPLAGALVVLRFLFRQQPIWGSPDGLNVGTGRRARRIPWSKVGQPEWAWYAFDTPGSLPVASVEIEGEPRRVFFYASAESIRRLSAWRAEDRKQLPAERPDAPAHPGTMSASAPAEPSTTPPNFPLLVVPITIALIVMVNVLLLMLRAGHALLAIGLLIAVVAALVLAVTRRTPSRD